MDPVTTDLFFTLLVTLCLTLTSLLALRLLPSSFEEIHADVLAWKEVGHYLKATMTLRPAYARANR